MKENWRKKMPATTTLEGQMVKSGRRRQSDLPLNEEQDFILKARNGSPAAIELLVSRYESRIFRLARNITGNIPVIAVERPGDCHLARCFAPASARYVTADNYRLQRVQRTNPATWTVWKRLV
jgi:hypothetical protein